MHQNNGTSGARWDPERGISPAQGYHHFQLRRPRGRVSRPPETQGFTSFITLRLRRRHKVCCSPKPISIDNFTRALLIIIIRIFFPSRFQDWQPFDPRPELASPAPLHPAGGLPREKVLEVRSTTGKSQRE